MRPGLASVARGLSRLVRLPSVIESTAREQVRLRQERAAADVHDLDAAQQAGDGVWMPPPEGATSQHRPQQSA